MRMGLRNDAAASVCSRGSGKEEGSDPAVIVTLDADGQHTISDALRVCERAEEKPGTLVLGSRKLDHDVPLRSKIGNTITRHPPTCTDPALQHLPSAVL